MRRASAIVAACIGIGALVAPMPSRAEQTTLPTIGHLTTISGRQSGYIRVRVPVQSELDLHYELTRETGPNEDIHITGKGRFVGFALFRERFKGSFPRDARVAGMFNRCDREGCEGRHPLQYAVGSSDIPPGIYRLYLIADGAPVKVTLRLKGPRGRAWLRPTTRVRIPMASPRPVFVEDAHHGYFSGGATYRLESPSWMASALWVATERLGGVYSACMYRGGAAERDGAFSPDKCATDNYQGSQPDVFPPAASTRPVEYSLFETDRGVPKGTWSKGYWWASTTPVTNAGMTTVFVPFR